MQPELQDDMVPLHVTIGKMYCNTFRNLIDQIKMRGIPIECEEKTGFFKNTFDIKSDLQTVIGLDKVIKDWSNTARDDSY